MKSTNKQKMPRVTMSNDTSDLSMADHCCGEVAGRWESSEGLKRLERRPKRVLKGTEKLDKACTINKISHSMRALICVSMIFFILLNHLGWCASTPKFSIAKFHTQLTLSDSTQCQVGVSETITYLFTEKVSSIERTIPANLPFGYILISDPVNVIIEQSDTRNLAVKSIGESVGKDQQRKIVTTLNKETASNEQITLSFSYNIKGPLKVFKNLTRVGWSVGYEEATSISAIDVSVKFPTKMLASIKSEAGIVTQTDGPVTTVTFPSTKLTSPMAAFRPIFTANNLLFDKCQTYWYNPGTSYMIIILYGVVFIVFTLVLGIKVMREEWENARRERDFERQRFILTQTPVPSKPVHSDAYSTHKPHSTNGDEIVTTEEYESDEADENTSFLNRGNKYGHNEL